MAATTVRVKGRPNHRLVKLHRSYTAEEVAGLFGLHRNTVRQWVKRGLATSDDRRPVLILGRDLVDYLKSRRVDPKRRCAPGEMFCLRCRVPRAGAEGVARYVPHTAAVGNLTAACSVCGCQMFRRVNRLKLGVVCGHLRVTLSEAQEDLTDTACLSLNGDFNQ